jgi:hypothetical protein
VVQGRFARFGSERSAQKKLGSFQKAFISIQKPLWGYRHCICDWWKKCQFMVGKVVCALSFPQWKACRERF